MKDIEKSSDEQVIIEIETVPSSRRMVLAIKALNEGRLIRTNDGRFLDIKDVAIDEEGVITVGTKNKNKKFSPNEYEVIMPKNVGGKKVNIKTVMRLHLTPKSIRVLMKEDIPPIGDLLSETNVFLEKHNVNKGSYVTTIGASASIFFEQLRLHIDEIYDDYQILLRLNCEGAEDDVIYSLHESFGSKVRMICGSLKDVEDIKGLDAYQKLDKYMSDNKLPFINFNSAIDSWPNAHTAIMDLLDKSK